MSPLPEPPAWTQPLPEATPPADMSVHHLPTGSYENRAAFAFKGGSFRDKRDFASSAILVRHPRGDLLIDAGFGTDVDAHLALLPRFMRTPHRATRTVAEQLDAAGYDRGRLLGVLPTHTHWDHVGGLEALAGTPIWMNEGELRYAAKGWEGTVYRQVSQGHEIRGYGFDDRPYLGFPTSFDVHGDGSVVVVHAPGHTTGSVVVFVHPPTGPRYAFIGDLTWQLEGIRERAGRPWLLSKMADSDTDRVHRDQLRMIALDRLFRIVPAHDLRAYEGIPAL
ncbi:MBL fold metallo-hydrolase [Actinoplanes sp. NPDC049265]|uniref:MBL fold metallo-hydrolase n=1 Tax=Actinoplanes sp. NPDC049265 TaxID=3363902 RepID=UPI00371A7239